MFKLNPTTGAETVLQSFELSSDIWPTAGLINVRGKLYGTTVGGGFDRCSDGAISSCGTVFAITP